MSSPKLHSLAERAARWRDFAISIVLHLGIVLVFGTTILFQVVQEPPDIVAELAPPEGMPMSPRPETPRIAMPDPLEIPAPPAPERILPDIIRNHSDGPLHFPAPHFQPRTTEMARARELPRPAAPGLAPGLPDRETIRGIARLTRDWVERGARGEPARYRFTAFVGRYSGGDWNSTVRVEDGRISGGSLPNLLYLMSFWSKDRIQTNYRDVRAIRLDSEELFTEKPPFIFLTGTRDFRLTETEVENLRRYLRMGGCVWGDSSVPGERSRFDIAFRREMRRVLPDVDKDFEPLPPDHPIFSSGYFARVREIPPGLNYYRNPVEVMRLYGQIAVIYTPNDYGNMWRIGLDAEGNIDLRRDGRGRFVAIDEQLYRNRATYARNLDPESLKAAFEFGTNVVIHLLTRWDGLTKGAGAL